MHERYVHKWIHGWIDMYVCKYIHTRGLAPCTYLYKYICSHTHALTYYYIIHGYIDIRIVSMDCTVNYPNYPVFSLSQNTVLCLYKQSEKTGLKKML